MSKEHAYAYEAGYRDGSINYELEHCPACKNVADLQEALGENARLRSELESVGTAAYLYGRGDLLAENAALRELVGNVWHLLYDWLFKAHEVPYDELKAVSDRMRELGVEVPDGD